MPMLMLLALPAITPLLTMLLLFFFVFADAYAPRRYAICCHAATLYLR